MTSNLLDLKQAYDTAKCSLDSGLNQSTLSQAKKVLESSITRLIRVNGLEEVPEIFLDAIEGVLNFYETLCLLTQHQSLKLINESPSEILPLELVFTSSGSYINSVWYSITSFGEVTYYTLKTFGKTSLDFQVWSLASRLEAIADNKVMRYTIPLDLSSGLGKTSIAVLVALVKSFFNKKRCAHINTSNGSISGSETFLSFIANSKVGSSLVLFDASISVECVDFFFSEGFDLFASAKKTSKTELVGLAFLRTFDREALRALSLNAFYGTSSFLDLGINPVYANYGHLNRQYIGFSHEGKTSDPSVRFSVSLTPSSDGVPVFLMKAEPAVKAKSSSATLSSAVPDLDHTVQFPPLRRRTTLDV